MYSMLKSFTKTTTNCAIPYFNLKSVKSMIIRLKFMANSDHIMLVLDQIMN